jgi:hypothetical protein
MTPDSRHDRTVTLLAARLETIALAVERRAERNPHLESHVLRAAMATRNAVLLELISPEEADCIWAEAAERHPAVSWVRHGPSLAA